MNTRNRPSSTQEDVLVDTSEESEQEDESPLLTRQRATTAIENTPPPLTQNTASAVEALFLIKQEEQHEFTHNSANKQGPTTCDDGMVVYGMTQEQREAANSAIEQEQQQPQIRRKIPVANPYLIRRPFNATTRADPPASQPSPIPTNTTTATPSPPTAIVATTTATASLPPTEEDNSDSDDDLAKAISSNLVDDDCMLFSEEERKTLGTNRGKNTGAHEARKVATEHRLFDLIKNYS